MSADVPIPALGSIGRWGLVEGELKLKKLKKMVDGLIRA